MNRRKSPDRYNHYFRERKILKCLSNGRSWHKKLFLSGRSLVTDDNDRRKRIGNNDTHIKTLSSRRLERTRIRQYLCGDMFNLCIKGNTGRVHERFTGQNLQILMYENKSDYRKSTTWHNWYCNTINISSVLLKRDIRFSRDFHIYNVLNEE